jgi:DNA-binding transcriptional regulator LsrR (DeoR family)
MLTQHYHTGGKDMIKMAQLEYIRKLYFMEGLSIREISRRTGIHRDTIAKYISLEVFSV